MPPVTDEDKWGAVRKYLTSKRKLPSNLIDSLHNSGLIYADQNKNAVFLRRSINESKITGANLRGTAGSDNKFKGLAKGTRRNQGWFYFQQGGQSGDIIKSCIIVFDNSKTLSGKQSSNRYAISCFSQPERRQKNEICDCYDMKISAP